MRNIPMVLRCQKTWQLLRNAVVTRQLLASTSLLCQQSHLPTLMWHSGAFRQHVNPSLLLSMLGGALENFEINKFH
jgi:hypothetical protein